MTDRALPDSTAAWVGRLPRAWRPYARLARFDRPAGTWLLYWPCAWGLALGGGGWPWALALLAGAAAMRGAGCAYNDIVDRDLDQQVARTRDRPVASGAITVAQARAFMLALVAVGFGVWLALGTPAKLVALASLALVAAYPFMKRLTTWPQAWLGLTFNWGALVAWTEARGGIEPAAIALWAGGVAWTLGYDTIYALQDRDDDVVAGIGSSARALGRHARSGVAMFYAAALGLWVLALHLRLADPLAPLALAPAAAHLAWQAVRLRPDDPVGARALFRANRVTGALVALACVAVGAAAL